MRYRPLAAAKYGVFGALVVCCLGASAVLAQEASPLVTGSVPLPNSETLARQFLQGQLQGVVVPTQSAKLAARNAGTIISIGPENGEFFSKGDVLVAFDCRRARAELAQADAKLDGATARYEVQRKRVENGSAGSLKLVEAEVLLREAEAAISLSRQAVQECTIIAPFDGAVEARIANPHETVNVRDPLLNIVAITGHEVRAYVPSSLLRSFTPGDFFSFIPDEAEAPLLGKIVAFGARVDNVSRLVEMRGELQMMPDYIRPGVSGRLELGQSQAAK